MSRRNAAAAAVLLLGILVSACTSDPEPANSGAEPTEATTPTDGATELEGGSGEELTDEEVRGLDYRDALLDVAAVNAILGSDNGRYRVDETTDLEGSTGFTICGQQPDGASALAGQFVEHLPASRQVSVAMSVIGHDAAQAEAAWQQYTGFSTIGQGCKDFHDDVADATVDVDYTPLARKILQSMGGPPETDTDVLLVKVRTPSGTVVQDTLVRSGQVSGWIRVAHAPAALTDADLAKVTVAFIERVRGEFAAP